MKAPKEPQRTERLVQVVDGKADKWYKRKDGTAYYHTVCCDCGLTHKEQITNKPKHFLVRVWRDDELTKRFRKKKDLKKLLREASGSRRRQAQ